MGSYYRDGGDYLNCIECGSKFDVNAPERLTIHEGDGGRFQPYCNRHLRQKLDAKYGSQSEATCIACGELFPTEELGTVNHMHPTGEVDPVFVCSTECTIKQLRSSAVWRWHGHDAKLPDTTVEDSRRAREVADCTVEHISKNYRCAATLLPRLVDMNTFEFTVTITHPYEEVDETYVERFNRIGIDTPYGSCTLKLIDYAAFGVCKFGFELTDTLREHD